MIESPRHRRTVVGQPDSGYFPGTGRSSVSNGSAPWLSWALTRRELPTTIAEPLRSRNVLWRTITSSAPLMEMAWRPPMILLFSNSSRLCKPGTLRSAALT